jgi:hypothetical protein
MTAAARKVPAELDSPPWRGQNASKLGLGAPFQAACFRYLVYIEGKYEDITVTEIFIPLRFL